MALAPRRRRRRRARLLLVAVVLSIVTISVSMVSSAQTDGRGRRISEAAYFDEVRPLVERSSSQGGDLRQVRAQAARLGREGTRRQLARVTQEARAVQAGVEQAKPPKTVGTTHTLLVATLAIRTRSAEVVEDAMTKVFSDAPLNISVEALARAGEDLAAADRTYQVFLDAVPTPPGAPALMPLSRWIVDRQPWAAADLAVFAAALRASVSPSAVHDLRLLVLTTKPAFVGNEGGASVLPLARVLQLELVVANVGNSVERDVPVLATLSGPGDKVETAQDKVELEPGQRKSLVLALHPAAAGAAAVTVVVGPVAGEANGSDNQQFVPVVLRG